MDSSLIFKVQNIVKAEHFFSLLFLALCAWLFYKKFLRDISADRHRIFQDHLDSLIRLVVVFSVFFGLHEVLLSYRVFGGMSDKISFYTGIITILLGASILITTLKIIAYEYFFLKSMKAGVPLILVNVFSLILSLFILGWILTSIFEVQLASVLTTSAVLTIVLGLALQDTLGNLFAAISLQIDKPFELDDWIELKNGTEKISGQVKEISWRATVLLAITDEYITLPNRMLAQWQIINFSAKIRPFYRGYHFRIPFDVSIEKAKRALLNAIEETPGILKNPEPIVIVSETTESWILLKAVYAIDNYGAQYGIADKFYENALRQLQHHQIPLATTRLHLSENKIEH